MASEPVPAESGTPQETPFQKSLSEYRKFLQDAEQKCQDNYYKMVLALSGGALGVSFAFVKDIVPIARALFKCCLFCAWICWSLVLQRPAS
jgi:hypothetical protein